MAQVRFAPSHELRSLNKRLAVYIDRVHGMEEKENRLNQAIENAMKTAEREMMKQKGVYERELADSRSRVGEMTKENAKLQLDSKKIGMELDKFKAELEALNHKYNKTKNEILHAKNKIFELEIRNNALSASLQQFKLYVARLKEEEKRDVTEKENLAPVPDLQRQLESELLIPSDLENRNQTLKEDLEFKQDHFEQQMSEICKNREVEIVALRTEQHEEKHDVVHVQSSLQELREFVESEMKKACEHVSSTFQEKVKQLEEIAEKQRELARTQYEEMCQTRVCLVSYQTRLSDLESSSNFLKNRVNKVEEVLDMEREEHIKAIAACQEEIQRLSEKFNMQLQKTQDLHDNQKSLRKEIERYRKLLEGEESRLDLMQKQNYPSPEDDMEYSSTTQVSGSDSPFYGTVKRPTKRRRTSDSSSDSPADIVISSHITGDVRVTDAESLRKCICLRQSHEKVD